MALETDAIDLDTAALKGCYNVLRCGCFCTGVFDVVIVVVQLDACIVQSSSLVSDGDIFGSNLAFIRPLADTIMEKTYGRVEDV
jgi:hypothetical protein